MPIIIGFAILALAVGAALFFRQSKSMATKNTSSLDNKNVDRCPSPAANTISYCGNKFNSIEVKQGATVTVNNNSSVAVEFESDPHPTHTDNLELNLGIIQPGASTQTTMNRAGSWKFHNHLNSAEGGSVIVK